MTNRTGGAVAISRFSSRYVAAAAVPVAWQSMSEAISPPYT